MTTPDSKTRIDELQIAVDDLAAKVEGLYADDSGLRARLDALDSEVFALNVRVGDVGSDFEDAGGVSRFNALEEVIHGLKLRLDYSDASIEAQRTHVDTLFATWEGMQERADDRMHRRIARLEIDQSDGLKQIMLRLDEMIDKLQAVTSAARE
jgi:hypothetical protein